MKLDVAEGLWSRIKKKWLFQACFFLNSNASICIVCYRFYAISVAVKRKEKKNETTKRRTTYRFHSHSCLLIANNEIFLFASQSFVRQCSLFHRSRNLCSMHVLRYWGEKLGIIAVALCWYPAYTPVHHSVFGYLYRGADQCSNYFFLTFDCFCRNWLGFCQFSKLIS